jgi:hypothetical protein
MTASVGESEVESPVYGLSLSLSMHDHIACNYLGLEIHFWGGHKHTRTSRNGYLLSTPPSGTFRAMPAANGWKAFTGLTVHIATYSKSLFDHITRLKESRLTKEH